MFKHITPHPWTAGKLTVWSYPHEHGKHLVANCTNRNIPVATQRANARLIAIAPQMYEIIQKMHGNPEAMALVAYMEKSHED
jgi:hypothetical protein